MMLGSSRRMFPSVTSLLATGAQLHRAVCFANEAATYRTQWDIPTLLGPFYLRGRRHVYPAGGFVFSTHGDVWRECLAFIDGEGTARLEWTPLRRIEHIRWGAGNSLEFVDADIVKPGYGGE